MSESSETVLWTDTLVKLSGETNQCYCYACMSFVTWQDHISKTTHIKALEKFNATSELKGLIYLCKICDKYLVRPEIEAHAKLHDNCVDNYQLYFKNNIVEWKEHFYCCLCNVTLLDSVLAIQHIDKWSHKILIKKSAKCSEFPVSIPPKENYKSLVSEGFTPVDKTRLDCRFCKLAIAFDKTKEHVEAFCHWYFKINFSLEDDDKKTNETDSKVVSHNLQATESAKSQNESSLYLYFEEWDKPYVFCKVCDFFVEHTEENTKLHLTGKFHIDALKKHGCDYITLTEGDIYFCKCCKLSLSNRQMLHLHIKDETHAASMFSLNDQKLHTSQTETTKSVVVPTNVPCNFIVRKDAMNFYCKVCDLELSEAAVTKHSLESSHESSLTKYGCDGISMRGFNDYHCRYCGCWIAGRNNVFLHIKGRRHTCCLLISQKDQVNETIKKNADETKPERPEWSKALSLMSNELSKLSEQLKRKSKAKKLHHSCQLFAQPMEIDVKPTSCDFCGSIEPNAADLHCHMAGHLTMDFLMSRANKNDYNQRKNLSLSKPQIKLKKLVDFLYPYEIAYFPKNNLSPINDPRYNKVQVYHKCNELHDYEKSSDSEDIIAGNCGPVKIVEMKNTKDLVYCIYNKLQVYHKCNELHDYEKFSNSEDIIAGNCGTVKTVAMKNTKDFSRLEISDSLLDSSSGYDETDDAGLIYDISSIISNDLRLPNIIIKKNDTSTMPDHTTVIAGDYSSEKNIIIEDPKSVCKIKNNNQSFDQKRNDNSSNYNVALNVSSDDEHFIDSETLQIFNEQRKMTMRKIINLLDFDKDYIYEMADKKREIELGIKLSLIIDGQNTYCLICRRNVSSTPHNYFEHLNTLDHIEYLEGMEKDHALFEFVTGQFSELDLTYQYMQEVTEDIVQCLICDKEIINDNRFIKNHIKDKVHKFARNKNHSFAEKRFNDSELRMRCDWYNIHTYWCVPCSVNFKSEVNFVRHLESRKHLTVMKNRENREKKFIYDFCAPCALLWYGYRCTYSYHCDIASHKWLLRDGHYSLPGLPKLATNLLASPEKFVDDIVNHLDSVEAEGREEEKIMIDDLLNAVKPKFCNAKAYLYGLRAAGLHSPDGDFDVFLECENKYNGNVTSESIYNSIKHVHKCLIENSQTWDVTNELPVEGRKPEISASHKVTGILCNISFENGLSVENTKLVKTFNNIFPLCRKMILFLNEWLDCCNLSGTERISRHALCWCVIFYLQKESILPSIAVLVSMNRKSQTIAGWEVGVTHEFSYNKFQNIYSLKELLIRFFKFYANFDFRYDVACPLLGREIKKRAFTNPHKLPKEMGPYKAYMQKSIDPEPLRIDSVMCIQDPFDLHHNITKDVSKIFLYRFRTCCSKSLDVLCS